MEPRGHWNHDLASLNYWYIRIVIIILFFTRLFFGEQDSHINVATFRSSFQTIDQPGTLKYVRSRCKTCPLIHNVKIISEPKRSTEITEHFTCTSINVIYCIACIYCKKLYIGETGRRLGYPDSENTFAT